MYGCAETLGVVKVYNDMFFISALIWFCERIF